MQKIWNKGHRIRASDKHLVYHFSIVVDMELKGRIREALIKMILDFDIPLETEE